MDKEGLWETPNQHWDATCYTHTKISENSLQEIVNLQDLAVYIDPKTAGKSKIIRTISEDVPEIKRLAMDKKPEPQKIAYISSSSSIVIDEMVEPKEKHVFVIGTEEAKTNVDGLYEIYSATKKLAELAKKKSKTKITLVFQKEWSIVEFRKALECALGNEELKVEVYAPMARHY